MPKTENWKPNTQIQIEAKLVLGYITTSQKQLTKARVKAKKSKPRDEANPSRKLRSGLVLPQSGARPGCGMSFTLSMQLPLLRIPSPRHLRCISMKLKMFNACPGTISTSSAVCAYDSPQLDPLDLVQANGKSIDNYGHGQWSDSLSSTDWPCLICIARASRLLPLPLVTSFFFSFLAVVYETE